MSQDSGKRAVRLGLYGCGNRTRALLDSLYGEAEFQVVAAYDIRAEALREVLERHGGKACSTESELIEEDRAEAFLISLDPFAHPDAFDKALEAGKPIFIEKPIALSAKRAYQMMKKAEEGSVPVQVGFMRRYMPEQAAARKFMEDNPPGRFFGISCNWFHPGETEMINCVNHFPGNFRLRVSQIPFHCCHALDVMRMYGGDVKAVDARGVKWVERNYPSPDKVIALFEFESGALGNFHYSSMSYKHEISYVIHAENYTLTLEGDLQVWRRPRYQSLRDDGSKDCRPTYHNYIGPDRYTFGPAPVEGDILLRFLNSVRDGTPMVSPIEEAHKVAEIAEAIEMSCVTKQVIELPLNYTR